MSTLVCGKRDAFEDHYGSSPIPSKRSRYSARLSPPRTLSAAEKSPLFQSYSGFEGASIARLRELFPGTDDIVRAVFVFFQRSCWNVFLNFDVNHAVWIIIHEFAASSIGVNYFQS